MGKQASPANAMNTDTMSSPEKLEETAAANLTTEQEQLMDTIDQKLKQQ